MRFHAFGIGILFLTLVRPLPSESTRPAGIADPGSDGLRPVNRPVETIDVHVNEVNLVLSVTEHNGKFVNNLRPSDLTILITASSRQGSPSLNVRLISPSRSRWFSTSARRWPNNVMRRMPRLGHFSRKCHCHWTLSCCSHLTRTSN